MVIFVFCLLCSILGAALLSRYNKAGTGLLLGLFLGPFGVLFALIIRSGESKKEEQRRHCEQINAIENLTIGHNGSKIERECPYCAEIILEKAKICKHCGRDV